MGEILKYRYTACIPSCLDNEDVFMLACIDTSFLRRSSLRVIIDKLLYLWCNAWAWAWVKHFMDVTKSFMGVVSCLSAIRRQFCIEKSHWEFEFCLLSRIKKRLLLGGCFSITTMLTSICNTKLVCCREVVRFSEGPLSEAQLYIL